MARPPIGIDTYRERVLDKFGADFEVSDDYISTQKPVTITHNCGYSWRPRAGVFLKSNGCPRCTGREIKDEKAFQERIDRIYGEGEFELVSPYSYEKVTVRHKCGWTHSIRPSTFISAPIKCQGCQGNEHLGKRIFKTDEDFKRFFNDNFGEEYQLVSEYDGHLCDYITVKHKDKDCGYTFSIRASSFLKRPKCTQCLRYASRFPEFEGPIDRKYRSYIEKEYHGEYTVVGGHYIGVSSRLTYKHNKCGNTWKTTKDSFSRIGCPICHSARRVDPNYFNSSRYNTMIYKKKVREAYGSSYTTLSSYKKASDEVEIRHLCDDGSVYEFKVAPCNSMPDKVVSGVLCPRCRKLKFAKERKDKVRQRVEKRYGANSYRVLANFSNLDKRVIVEHEACGTHFEVNLNSFLNKGRGCPVCYPVTKSYGERLITKILKKHKVGFVSQKKFSDLVDTMPLSYDFYIESKNVLIEYDGKQHYQPVDFFGSNEGYKRGKLHDKMKDEYALNHQIKLLRIPYYYNNYKDIENILIKKGII